jgi:1-acyl-sn-glycerol-3-phosphate acyltransferase
MSTVTYDDDLARGRRAHPCLRIGRPGVARTYRLTRTALQGMRLRVQADVQGADNVAPGGAILVGNHLATLDPVVAAMSLPWRITAFTKAEWFEGPAAPFFRFMGQIPLRRGDEVSTEWALDMASGVLGRGDKVGIYPEGTRGPDATKLYRLHQRVLVPLITGNPGVPVHVVATTYGDGSFGRQLATVRISPRLPIDPESMTGQQMTDIVRDTLVELGGFTYVNQYAFVVKARAERAERAARDDGAK